MKPGSPILIILTFLYVSLLLTGCQDCCTSKDAVSKAKQPRIGYSPNPLLAPLYAAQAKDKSWELTRFGTSGDIGYSLISGEIDAGFVETEKALQLIKAPGGEKLKVAGSLRSGFLAGGSGNTKSTRPAAWPASPLAAPILSRRFS